MKQRPPTKDVEQLRRQNVSLQQTVTVLEHQLDWFKRQLFGSKSEAHPADLDQDPQQQDLFAHPSATVQEAPSTTIQSHTRKKKKDRQDSVLDQGLRFGDDVPVKVIDLTPDELKGESADDYVILRYESTHRLSQLPGSYVVLEYRTPVYKKKDEATLKQAPAPVNVLEKCVVDVSFLAGMLVDKFAYHLPLYRQHQRLQEAGIKIARSSLVNWCTKAALLLEPIVDAQFRHLLTSSVLGMDEVPLKVGKVPSKRNMKQGYLWPMYGDQHEVVFHYNASRGTQVVEQQLEGFEGVLVCDGYAAYQAYTDNKASVTLANCWAHTRRYFEKVKTIDPQASEEALNFIQALYRHEKYIRDQALSGKDKLDYRTRKSEPIVKQFWQWCYQQQQRPDLFPKHPLMTALNYALSRVEPLQVFLSEPDVPLDTNHVERCLRPIPMGRKNWLFCWSEMGAHQVAIIQSLIVTCRLHDIHPYQYLVDVLQRVAIHPASKIEQLTPRLWKEHFADDPMVSDVVRDRNDGLV